MEEEEVIRRWGTQEQYYKELEEFYEKHQRADCLTFDTESRVLVKAEYYFRPWQVAVEHRDLMRKLAEQEPAPGGDGGGG